MNNQVIVAAHPATGNVITPNKNKPEFGTIRVDESHTSMENGFLNNSRRSAFIAGKIEDLTALGLKAGSTLAGRIVRTESKTPFFTGQAAKINPTTKKQVLVDGAPVYFQDRFTADVNACDSLVKASAVAAPAKAAELVS